MAMAEELTGRAGPGGIHPKALEAMQRLPEEAIEHAVSEEARHREQIGIIQDGYTQESHAHQEANYAAAVKEKSSSEMWAQELAEQSQTWRDAMSHRQHQEAMEHTNQRCSYPNFYPGP